MRRSLTVQLGLLAGALSLVASTASAPRPVPAPTVLAPVELVADRLEQPVGVAVDQAGAIFVSEEKTGRITELAPDGTRTIVAAGFDHPMGLAVDPQGRLLIVEQGRGGLWRLEPTGKRTLLASEIRDPRWVAVADDGTIYISAQGLEPARGDHSDGDKGGSPGNDHEADKSDVILRLGADGTLQRFAEGFEGVEGIALTAEAVYAVVASVPDTGDHANGFDHANGLLIRTAIEADGTAGPLEILAQSDARDLLGLALDRLGAAFFTGERQDDGESTRERRDDGKHGDEHSAGGNQGIVAVWRDAHPLVTFASDLAAPGGVAFEAAGNLLVALGDEDDGRLIRFRAPAAPVVTAPGFTNQTPFSVTGHADPGDLVSVFRKDDFTTALVTAVAQASDGAFTLAVPLTRNAKNELAVTATGAGGTGLTSAPADVTIVHDDIAPTVTILQPQAGVFVRQVIQVQASAADSGSGVASMSVLLDTKAIGAQANPDPTQPMTATFNIDTRTVPDGTHTLTVSAADRAGNIATTAVTVIADNTPPHTQITSAPATVITGTTATVTFTGTDNLTSTQTLVFAWQLDGGAFTAFSSATTATLTGLAPGSHTFAVKARDQAGNEDPTPATAVFRVNLPPTISLMGDPLMGAAPLTVMFTATTADPNGEAVTVTWNFGDGTTATGTGPQTHRYQAAGTFTATGTVSDGFATAQTTVTVTVAAGGGGVPPDPKTVAPPIDSTVATNLNDATNFLYSGATPIQTGVAPGTIVPTRAAVLRGVVTTRDGTPLPAVQITILNHPEFGQTLSRLDGAFDLAVNGGGVLTVNYVKTGFLPAQRQISVPWQDYALVPTVALVSVDPQVTAVTLSAASPLQVAQGSMMTDADGSRRATLLFPSGTTATMRMPDGSTQPLTTLSVRATEYTVGPNGPAAMPALLPPTSGYTYAVELSADEAMTAGAAVTFSQPIVHYVENFLGFPTGRGVPVGFYDRAKAAWVPEDNGRVIKILSVSNGVAQLDVDGSGQSANAAALTALGITDVERQQLATLYQPGQSVWRVPITHFSPLDCNWPSLPPGATAPDLGPPKKDKLTDPSCEQSHSIIGCQNQTLGEVIPIVGTPMRLHYSSGRVPGRQAKTFQIQLSGASVPATLKRIDLEVQVAGRRFAQSFPAAPNQAFTFKWDGVDAYGRLLQGAQPITVRIGYAYVPKYFDVLASGRSFAAFARPPLSVIRDEARQELIVTQEFRDTTAGWDARGQGLGAWTMTAHHAYDPVARVLHRGDGTQRDAQNIGQVIRTIAGTGVPGIGGDGGPAIAASLGMPGGNEVIDIAVGPDGSVYVAQLDRVRRIAPNGIITTVAGGGSAFCDNCPATQTVLDVRAVAVGPDGSLYIGGTFISHVGLDGIIRRLAGGTSDFSSNDIPALQAGLLGVTGVAVAPDGSVYLSEGALAEAGQRIRRVGPDGFITTVAGQFFVAGFSGDGGPATQATLSFPFGIALGPDGSVYVADNGNLRVRRITPDGIIRTVAGTGLPQGPLGDGGPATLARVSPTRVSVGPDGSVYINDVNSFFASPGSRIRRVGTDGIITTVAGVGPSGFSGDGGPATAAQFSGPGVAVIAPDGTLVIDDTNNFRIRRVGLVFRGFGVDQQIAIASEDGSELYQFDATGRHLRTLGAVTGTVRYQFAYDGAGRITTMTDRSGNVTTIERDGQGNPTAIVAPGGQRTALTVDANGFLSTIRNPAGETVELTSTPDGLLTQFADARGGVHSFTYDSLGRLTRDQDATGAAITFARTDAADAQGFTVTQTTALGRQTTYQVQTLPTGAQQQVNTFPDGFTAQPAMAPDGTNNDLFTDGTKTQVVLGPDPRWGMQAPVSQTETITSPSGVASTISANRTATLADPDKPLSLLTQTDAVSINGRQYTTTFDATSRTITFNTPTGRKSSTTLDPSGNVIRVDRPVLATQFSYDSQGRPRTITQGSSSEARQTAFSYTSDGYLATATDPIGRLLQYKYDAAGRRVGETLPDGRAITFQYDANNNLTSVTSPGRQPHTFTFTPANQLASYVPPALGSQNGGTVYTYNADHKQTQIQRADGQKIAFAYDSAGRLQTVTLPSGSYSYGFDPTSRQLVSVTSPDGETLRHTSDGTLRTGTGWTGAISGTVSRTYDANFRIVSRSVNGGTPVPFQYDADSALVGAGAFSLTRDAQTALVTATTLGNVTDTWTYNSLGELTTYTAMVSGTPVYSVQYTRDGAGQVIQQQETVGGATHTFAYSYDSSGRLQQVSRDGAVISQYAYDTNSNRTQFNAAVSTYDARDQLVQSGTTTFVFSADGELLDRTTNGQTTTYQYDALGNLITVMMPAGMRVDYVLDGQQRRIGKKINGTLAKGFLYQDQLRIAAELDGQSNVVSRFVYATHANVPDYMTKGTSTYRIITDQLGSPRLVVDSMTGAIAQRMDYDEFGNVAQDTNPGFQPFGFAGGIYDPDTNLVHFGSREYDATTGRWISRDPILFAGGLANLYVYAGNDPVDRTDPTGLQIVGRQVVGCVNYGNQSNGDYLDRLGLDAAISAGVAAVSLSGIPAIALHILATGQSTNIPLGVLESATRFGGVPGSRILWSAVPEPAAIGSADITVGESLAVLADTPASAALGWPGFAVIGAGAAGAGVGLGFDAAFLHFGGQSFGEWLYDLVHQDEIGTRWYSKPCDCP